MKSPITISNDLSRYALRLIFERPGSPIRSIGSGFFWQTDEALFLFTNWHNVTGLHHITRKTLHPSGYTPTQVRLTLQLKTRDSEHEGKPVTLSVPREVVLPLATKDDDPIWLEHPEFGSRIDVVALTISPPAPGNITLPLPINTFPDFVNFSLRSGGDAFVLGYPLNIDAGAGLPIWKRASIASEPTIDLGGLPKLLIDTATRKGMSGAPVFAVNRGWTVPIGGSIKDGYIGEAERFLGIYSSRVEGDDELGSQLGVVWKESAIRAIAENGRAGTNPFG